MGVATIYDEANQPVLEVHDLHLVDGRPVRELRVGDFTATYEGEHGGVSRYRLGVGPISPRAVAARKGCHVGRVHDAIGDGSLPSAMYEGVPGVRRLLVRQEAADAWEPPVRAADREVAERALRVAAATARGAAEAAQAAVAKAEAAERERQERLDAAGRPLDAA